jgi:hypothetical protein
VGAGVGAVMMTVVGFTAVRVVVFSPLPVPLVALKE